MREEWQVCDYELLQLISVVFDWSVGITSTLVEENIGGVRFWHFSHPKKLN